MVVLHPCQKSPCQKNTHLFRLHIPFCHPRILQKSTNCHESSEWRDQLCFNIAGQIIHQLEFSQKILGNSQGDISPHFRGGISPIFWGGQIPYLTFLGSITKVRIEIPPHQSAMILRWRYFKFVRYYWYIQYQFLVYKSKRNGNTQLVGGWSNPPIWKICACQIGSFPQG